MPVVFGPYLRKVAERAPVPTPRQSDDPDEASADAGESSGPRRLVLVVLAGAATLAVSRWLARRGGNDG
ncbi:hypothetical protein [Haloarcula brevis]|uniref:hypothetical protein n=1 Tax=Haloarcula brevis TaxID=3111453 RepID=UPI00300EB10E